MTPASLEAQHTLTTAVARFNELRTRELLAPTVACSDSTTPAGRHDPAEPPALDKHEALELLALGEVIARKAGYGRQLTVRSVRAAGASWSQIGAALGASKQSAWEAHTRWIDQQADRHGRIGGGLDEHEAAAARALAGNADATPPQ